MTVSPMALIFSLLTDCAVWNSTGDNPEALARISIPFLTPTAPAAPPRPCGKVPNKDPRYMLTNSSSLADSGGGAPGGCTAFFGEGLAPELGLAVSLCGALLPPPGIPAGPPPTPDSSALIRMSCSVLPRVMPYFCLTIAP